MGLFEDVMEVGRRRGDDCDWELCEVKRAHTHTHTHTPSLFSPTSCGVVCSFSAWCEQERTPLQLYVRKLLYHDLKPTKTAIHTVVAVSPQRIATENRKPSTCTACRFQVLLCARVCVCVCVCVSYGHSHTHVCTHTHTHTHTRDIPNALAHTQTHTK